MYRDIATAVYKRTLAEPGSAVYQLPGWAWVIVALDFVLFLPVFLMIGYTFNNIYPVLAMVEDPAPPAYEPVSLSEDGDVDGLKPVNEEAQQTRQITSSFRATYRTVTAISGWRSNFRGLACWIALSFSTAFVYGIVSSVLPLPPLVAAAISAAALVQLYTAWVHIVISAPSPKHFWQRLTPFKRTFQAAALPTVVYFLALEMQQSLPKLIARIMGMNMWDPKKPDEFPQVDASDSWKAMIVFITSLVLVVILVIPAHVVLTRVQASLLPEEDETIVPFDRAFQGKLVPAIVGGKGYVTFMDAWNTFSRASWIRLVKLYVKIFLVSMAVWIGMMVVIVPEFFIIMANSKKVSDGPN